MTQKESLHARYKSVDARRQYEGLRLNRDTNQVLKFMDSVIKKQFQSFSLLSFSICGGDRRPKIQPEFQNSFCSLSLEEKIQHYDLAVAGIADTQKQTSLQVLATEEAEFESLLIKVIKGLKTGVTYRIKLSSFSIDCSHYEIALNKYLLRRSKKDSKIFILESLAKQEPNSIRFNLVDSTPLKEQALLNQSSKNFAKYILSMNQDEGLTSTKQIKLLRNGNERSSPMGNSNMDQQSRSQISPEKPSKLAVEQQNLLERSVIQDLMHNEDNIDEIEDYIEQKGQEYSTQTANKRFKRNVAQMMLPHLSLADLQNFGDYLPYFRDQNLKIYIYQHSNKKLLFRLEMYFKITAEEVVRQLCQVQNYKLWNGSINQSHVKLSISSDNSFLVYLKQRAYNQFYRERDFLFLRHLCRVGSIFYLIDVSLDSHHFIPFESILRGNINHCVTKVETAKEGCRMLVDIDVNHAGLLPFEAKNELTVRFLKEFASLESFIQRFKGNLKNSYDFSWEISPSISQNQKGNAMAESYASLDSDLFDEPIESLTIQANQDDFYSIADDQDTPLVYQITKEELIRRKKVQEINQYNHEQIMLDENGLSILSKAYLTVRHALVPLNLPSRKRNQTYKNLMLKDDFSKDSKGEMKLTNQPKIASQNNVLKFIMGTIRKNLFSGKSILNISLPVEIFNSDSNLQRLCEATSMAPTLFERSCKGSALDRFKNCIAFGFTNSVLYFDIDKAFNPILGQTFQGFIEGCPVYGEQVSHHPPISSILLIGRGFRVYANIEAKVYVHLNSGEGVNEGFYTVEFDDGGKIVFQTTPGEVSGLTVGDRKFRFKGKMFVVDSRNRLFCSVSFEDESGMFSKNKWQFPDQMEGDILRVTEGFIHNFFENKSGKLGICPDNKDIEERLGRVSGRWLDTLKIDEQVFFNVCSVPPEMIQYQFPLHSNSNYRQDLLYRKRNDLARSQIEKERLQVFQRNDRKLRDKYHPTKH